MCPVADSNVFYRAEIEQKINSNFNFWYDACDRRVIVEKKGEWMFLRTLFLFGICLASNHVSGMEEVIELKEITDKRIRSLDAAQVFVSLSAQAEERGDYSFSSRLIAQVIKQKGLGSALMPDNEEVAFIKTLKKENPVGHSQLVKDVFQLLQAGEKLSELQQIRHRRVQAFDVAIQGKEKELRNLEKESARFDTYVNNNDKFFKNGGCCLMVVGVAEVLLLVITGILSGVSSDHRNPSCWSSQ